MSNRITTTLGAVAEVITGPFGSMLHQSDYMPTGTPVIMPQDIGNRTLDKSEIAHVGANDAERLSRYMVQENDIVYARRGDVEKHAFICKDDIGALCGTGCMRVRVDKRKAEPLYISFYLNRPESKRWISQHAVGSNMPNLNTEILNEVPLELPSLDDQLKSIAVLNSIDSKIQTNTRICAELEAMAKTIYDYWFTQFDFPNADGKPYRASGGEMVWNDQLKREIPKGWYSSVIANHIGTSKGGDWGKEEPEGNYHKEVVCIRGADFPSINGSKPLNAPVRYILSKNADKILSSGDIIVEISGGSPTQSTGRICYINEYTLNRFDKEIITSNFCKAFSTKKAPEQYWLYLLWKTLYDAGVLFGFEGKTTGIKNLLFDDFCAQYRIVAPDETILQKFHEVVSPIFDKIQQCNIENDELTRLRDWLLPMLMNGQATVE